MKKLVMIFVSVLLFVSPMMISQPVDPELSTMDEYTHTVFAEYATTTWCPNCPEASGGIYKVFQSGEYDFHYVTLVSDVNPNAQSRAYLGYFNRAIPSMYFDGGYNNFIGRGQDLNATAEIYEGLLDECGVRSDVSDMSIESQATWDGDAKMSISITVTNNGDSFYVGFLKSYVTEIDSRWNDYADDPYHYAFLDFAVNTLLFLGPGKEKSYSVEWDGAVDHDGISFADITEENIEIVTAVFNWRPYLKTGYESSDFTQQFFAFYADECTSTKLE